jgi:hypothetical protein
MGRKGGDIWPRALPVRSSYYGPPPPLWMSTRTRQTDIVGGEVTGTGGGW